MPLTHMPGDGVFVDAGDAMTDPPARLTKRGLVMLQEIWEAAGRPRRPAQDGKDTGWADADAIASLVGRQRRSAAQVRAHLSEGGYLHLLVATR